MQTLSAEGALFIKREEEEGGKPRLHAYDDGTGTATIAWGCTEGVTMDMVIDEAQAEQMFDAEITKKCAELNKVLTRQISQGLYDAVVSFAYNNGLGRCRKLLDAVNRGTDSQIRAAFLLYTHAKDERSGRVVEWPGLVKRRSAELAYWAQYDSEHGAPEPPAVDRTRPALPTAASSKSVWALICGAAAALSNWADEAFSKMGDIQSDVSGVQNLLATMATNHKGLLTVVTVGAIGVAVYRHTSLKRTA